MPPPPPNLSTGAYPHTHSLVRELSKVAKGAKRQLEDILTLTKIEDTYIGSRYLPRRYEKEEVEALLRHVKEKFKPVIDELRCIYRRGEKGTRGAPEIPRNRKKSQKIAEKAVGGVKVYVFGSVLTDRYTATS